MMGGLAYMTGRPGDPLRAGTSVNDIMGGLFGAIGALGALIQRGITGKGMEVQSALFENNVFLMGQHMLQFAMTGKHPAPMPARDNPWAVYDVFTVRDGEQIFLAAVSDPQWLTFCDALGFADLKADPVARDQQSARRGARSAARDAARAARRTGRADELAALFERVGLPFAPIRRPEDLYDDPHLNATGGLADIRLPDGQGRADRSRRRCFRSRCRDSASACASIRRGWVSTRANYCAALGYTDDEIDALVARGGRRLTPAPAPDQRRRTHDTTNDATART